MTTPGNTVESGNAAAGQRQDPSLSAMPDGATVLREYENAVDRMFALAAGIDPELPVPACPAWSARDIIAHLVGTAAFMISGNRLPEDIQGWIDDEVRVRADWSWQELRAEWDAVVPVAREQRGGEGSGAALIDAVTHEQDLRGAIGPSVTDHGLGLTALLPCLIDYVRHLAPFGDGPGARLLTPTSDVTIGGPETGVVVSFGDDWEMSRLLGCRRSAEQLAALPVQGDSALLYTLVSRYPLPKAAIA